MVIDLFGMPRGAVYSVCATDGIVRCQVLRFQSLSSHAGKSRSRAELDESLETVVRKLQILRLDPSHGGSELIGQQLYQNRIGEVLALLGAFPVIELPILEDLVKTRGLRFIVDQLHILPRYVERLDNEIRDVLANKEIRIEVTQIYLLRELLTMLFSLQTQDG